MSIKLIKAAYNKVRELYLSKLIQELDASEAKVTRAYTEHRYELNAAQEAVKNAASRLEYLKAEGSKAAEEVNRAEGIVQDELQHEIARVNGGGDE